jgi:polar amino acid transport system substrate-binding protein
MDQVMQKYIPGAEPAYFKTTNDAFEALRNGRVDAIMDDDAALLLFIAQNPGLRMLEPLVTQDELGVICAIDNNDLQGKLNEFIAQIKTDGTHDAMINRWLRPTGESAMPEIPEGNSGVLRFGTSGVINGFSFYKDGELVGFDVEFAGRFAAFMDMKLDIMVMDFGGLIPAVQSGKVDFAASMFTITEERKQAINFSDSYYTGGLAVGVYIPETQNQQALSFWDSLKTSIERNLILENRWMMIVDGLRVSLLITFSAFILATLLGFGVCGLRMSVNPVLKAIGSIYVTVLRGTPIVVLLMITFYIIFARTAISGVWVAVIAFGANGAAFISEIIKSAIMTIDKGQVEAARSMGFSKTGTFFTVILPQAVKVAFPVYMSEFISMFKMTSVVGYIAIVDLTKAGDIIRSRTYDAFFPLLLVALIYLLTAMVMLYILNLIIRKTDRRLRRAKR